MIKPTVGRILHYYANMAQEQPLAAIITHVCNYPSGPELINVTVFNVNGTTFGETLVPILKQRPEKMAHGSFCMWMDYQKGQAAKTEELERKLNEGHPAFAPVKT